MYVQDDKTYWKNVNIKGPQEMFRYVGRALCGKIVIA